MRQLSTMLTHVLPCFKRGQMGGLCLTSMDERTKLYHGNSEKFWCWAGTNGHKTAKEDQKWLMGGHVWTKSKDRHKIENGQNFIDCHTSGIYTISLTLFCFLQPDYTSASIQYRIRVLTHWLFNLLSPNRGHQHGGCFTQTLGTCHVQNSGTSI